VEATGKLDAAGGWGVFGAPIVGTRKKLFAVKV
jgi:hypothetical protein